MISEKLNELIKKREKNSLLDVMYDSVCHQEIELLADNCEDTIDFLKNDCTAEQLAWLSEVFEEISEKLQSAEFIDALYEVADRYKEDSEKNDIYTFIEAAKEKLLCS